MNQSIPKKCIKVGRVAYPVSTTKILALVAKNQRANAPPSVTKIATVTLGRGEVTWQTVVLKRDMWDARMSLD